MYALNLWRMCTPYLQRLGSQRWRRLLADLTIIFVPDPHLGRLREIVHTMHNTSLKVLENQKETIKHGGSVVSDIGEGKDILSTLGQLFITPSARSLTSG